MFYTKNVFVLFELFSEFSRFFFYRSESLSLFLSRRNRFFLTTRNMWNPRSDVCPQRDINSRVSKYFRAQHPSCFQSKRARRTSVIFFLFFFLWKRRICVQALAPFCARAPLRLHRDDDGPAVSVAKRPPTHRLGLLVYTGCRESSLIVVRARFSPRWGASSSSSLSREPLNKTILKI